MKQSFTFSPRRCILEVTYDCNCRCQTCCVWTETFKKLRISKRPYLTLSQLKKIQKGIAHAGIKRVTYLGGEPFMRKDLLALTKHARSLPLSTAVVSNGALITQPAVEKIIRQNLFDIIIFSLDGPEVTHDAIRGISGTFSRSTFFLAQLQKLKKSRKLKYPRIFLYVTVSALNTDYVDSLLKLAQYFNVNAIRFFSASCLDNRIIEKTNALFKSPAISTHSYAVSPQMRIPTHKLSVIRERLRTLEFQAKKMGITFQVEEYLRNGQGSKTCQFLGNDFVISAYGDVLPCPMLPDYTIGNVLKTSLEKILTQPSTISKARSIWKLSSHKELPVCGQCCVEKLAAA